MYIKSIMTFAAMAIASLAFAGSSSADLVSQYGILDLAANGGINPQTGVAWVDGDQYRLAFHTGPNGNETGLRDADSPDASVYNTWVTAQANLSTLGNGSITTSTGWTAMLSTVATNVKANTNTDETQKTGVAVYAMDGTTAIARDNSDI